MNTTRTPCFSQIAETPPSYDELIQGLSKVSRYRIIEPSRDCPTLNNAIVRRDTVGKFWVTVRTDHSGFEYEFTSGLMINVRFEGNAPAMMCRGFASSGEGVAERMFVSQEKDTAFTMPADATFRTDLKYNVGNRSFYSATGIALDSCDYVVLNSNGTAECGWKTEPEWHEDVFSKAASLM